MQTNKRERENPKEFEMNLHNLKTYLDKSSEENYSPSLSPTLAKILILLTGIVYCLYSLYQRIYCISLLEQTAPPLRLPWESLSS